MSGYGDNLGIGTSVDIQRTDGRVHSAIISGIHLNTKSVTVEWFERGEAKGKSIDLEAIFQLNPDLRQPPPSSAAENVAPPLDTTRAALEAKEPPATQYQKVTSVHQRANETVLQKQPEASQVTTRSQIPPTRIQTSNITRPAVAGNGAAGDDRQMNQSRLPTTSSAIAPSSVQTTSNNSVANISSLPAYTRRPETAAARPSAVFDDLPEVSESTLNAPSDLDVAGLGHLIDLAREPDLDGLNANWLDQDEADLSEEPSYTALTGYKSRLNAGDVQRRTNLRQPNTNPPPVQSASSPAAPNQPQRKSTCVKEIERIQQRREERRAAQRVVRDNVDLDPSNPSYEFYTMIKEYRATLDYRPMTDHEPIEDHQICVCVRKRPMNNKELGRREIDVVTVPNKQSVIIHEPKTKVDLTKYLENQQFRFDYTFDDSSDNELVYQYTAKPLVESIFDRGMATCFAYGQTGSGKTHTMGGEFHGRGQQDCTNGIYALAAADVFRLNSTTYRNEKLRVYTAFFEIYSGKVFDLLNKKEKLRVLEDGKNQVQVVGLREEPVASVDAVLQLLQHGQHIRTSGQTSANQHSSRSHAVFQLILKRETTGKLHGKFSLIDLAGNERGVDTSSSDRHTRMEGAEINKSLLALKECIRALGRKGAHLPFRASKLTQVLRDSFIGDRSRTCMIAMISPGMTCCEHTLNTLRYADRVKELGPGGLTSGGSVTDLPPLTARNGLTNAVNTRLPAAAVGSGDMNGQHQLSSISVSNRAAPTNFGSGGGGTALPHLVGTGAKWNSSYANGVRLEEEEDLAMVRSANNGEITDDLLTFQEVVAQIERMEEQVCDEHKALCGSMTEWTKEHFRLYKCSTHVHFDVEAYSSRMEQLLSTAIKDMTALKDKINAWRRELRQEEELSSRLQRSVRL